MAAGAGNGFSKQCAWGCRTRWNSEKRTCVTPVIFQMWQPLPLPSNDSDDSNVSTIITPSLAREIFTFPLFNKIRKKREKEKREASSSSLYYSAVQLVCRNSTKKCFLLLLSLLLLLLLLLLLHLLLLLFLFVLLLLVLSSFLVVTSCWMNSHMMASWVKTKPSSVTINSTPNLT